MSSTDGATANDPELHTEIIGRTDGSAKRLVLAHGFTQNGRCWGRFGELLAADNEVVLVDAPGHGRSGHDRVNLWQAADLLLAAGSTATDPNLDATPSPDPAIFIGYSMGGRTALHAALTSPESVRGLVLIGATAGLDDATDRADRRAADEALAERLLRDGLPAFLDRWLASPLFAGLNAEQAAAEERLTNRPDGLAASLRSCGTGTQDPLWSRLPELTMPVLIVVGEQDEKFGAIGRRMVAAMSATGAQLVEIPGTHAVHLERPEETATTVLRAIADW